MSDRDISLLDLTKLKAAFAQRLFRNSHTFHPRW
jgi:hypothetical protein